MTDSDEFFIKTLNFFLSYSLQSGKCSGFFQGFLCPLPGVFRSTALSSGKKRAKRADIEAFTEEFSENNASIDDFIKQNGNVFTALRVRRDSETLDIENC
jgi:hypothetical protein